MLKKEFKRKDVNRARNLLTGNSNASTGTQIGYNKTKKDYKEGDVWTEGRKTWTIKNGIKQTISKLDTIKKEVFTPLCCPNCGKVMKGQLDKYNYKVHKKCHDCVVEFEHKLKIKNQYKEYKKLLKTNNNIEYINQLESYLLEAVNSSNNEFVSENGEIERWTGGINKKKIVKDIVKNANIARKNIKEKQND